MSCSSVRSARAHTGRGKRELRRANTLRFFLRASGRRAEGPQGREAARRPEARGPRPGARSLAASGRFPGLWPVSLAAFGRFPGLRPGSSPSGALWALLPLDVTVPTDFSVSLDLAAQGE